jgi:nucleotide-binding universal stress UspA family protein
MQLLRTILFAADFSENSREAFRLACSLAVEDQTRLIVLHVAEPILVAEEPIDLGQPTVQFFKAPRDEVRHESLRRQMRDVYAPAHPLGVEYRTAEGVTAEEILSMADETGADLIVMGTHGRTGLRRLLAGSIATAVLRGAHCAVLALRSHERPPKAEGIRVILHPTDSSDGSEDALRVARSLARDLGARLVLLHVIPFDVFPSELALPVDT